ncbi:MAG: TraB/VirB10 family protein [Candidatus Brocadiales bacterium]|nr:TraB/VirB10 family protein [Candidatus Brocadiales bacterium]MBL7110290.1 TraB/VirB10 family protein [Candidatus Neomarinimicrobiota bacterium]
MKQKIKEYVLFTIKYHKEKAIWALILVSFFALYTFQKNDFIASREVFNYNNTGKVDEAIGSEDGHYLEEKNDYLIQKIEKLENERKEVYELLSDLKKEITELKTSKPKPVPSVKPEDKAKNGIFDSLAGLVKDSVNTGQSGTDKPNPPKRRRKQIRRKVVTFPVKLREKTDNDKIPLPLGSYVKAKILTGVEAAEGKAPPILIQLDYAYILPNNFKLDLFGCFMIAKSQGDLSTERVEVKPTKIGCLSQDGQLFESKIEAYVADNKDNSFAIQGKVNSKRDRVARQAFLAKIVEGIGSAISMSQSTQAINPLGGISKVLTGDSAKYIAGNAAASSASMVSKWYLQHARDLLPTINIGSGKDVWVVMMETLKIPKSHFKRRQQNEKLSFVNIID